MIYCCRSLDNRKENLIFEMGTGLSNLRSASRVLFGKWELLQNQWMRGKLQELTSDQIKNVREVQIVNFSSICNIVPNNREQLHLGKRTPGIGQPVRHQRGTGGAEYSGNSLEGGAAASGSEDSAGVTADSDGSGNVVSICGDRDKYAKYVKKDNENVDGMKKEISLRRYVFNVECELSHMTLKIKLLRQNTYLLLHMFGNRLQNINAILQYLTDVQDKQQHIEVLLCLLWEIHEVSIEESLRDIKENLNYIDADLINIQGNIIHFQLLVMTNKEQGGKLQHILSILQRNVTLAQYIVARIRLCNAYV